MVGVVDRPRGQPQHLALERRQDRPAVGPVSSKARAAGSAWLFPSPGSIGRAGSNYVAKMASECPNGATNRALERTVRQIMPTVALDAIDRRILTALQADARISNAALAEAVGLSPSPACEGCARWNAMG